MATNVSNIKLKKSNVISAGVKTKCKRINVNGELVWAAEETLANLTTGEPYVAGYAGEGWPNLFAANSGSYWNLSDYDYIRGSFSNTLKQVSWGAGGSFSNGALHTYLKFSDGTVKWLFDGPSATFTEENPIDLSGYTVEQKAKVYLHVTRDITVYDATNTHTDGEGTAIGCIAY